MKNILCTFVSGYTIGINNNCSSMLNAGSCAKFSSCGWVKLCMVCFEARCVVLCKDGDIFGALPPEAAKTWASGKKIPLLIGLDIFKALPRWSKILTI